MHKKLLTDAFKKAKNLFATKHGIDASESQCAEFLSEMLEEKKIVYTGRSLKNHYNKAKNNKSVVLKQEKVVQGLCEFLSYHDFEDFKTKNPETKSIREIKKNKILPILIAGVIIIVVASFLYFPKKDCWMQWQNEEYIKVNFNAKKLSQRKIVYCNEDILQNLKQIHPTCNTTFFIKNEPIVWYSKNPAGNYDYFTYYGKHPLTGKTLKPITKYIIAKYICNKN